MNNQNYVITIGRKLGSSAVGIGQKLAEHFQFGYLDRELIIQAAEVLGVTPEDVKDLERKSAFGAFFLNTRISDNAYIPPENYPPTQKELFDTQCQLMKESVAFNSCVIIGRAGNYIFKNYDKHVSIFLHADKDYRIQRAMSKWDMSPTEAERSINKSDKDRERYYKKFTGDDGLSADQYDICLDVSKFGIDASYKMILELIEAKFPELKK